jgi:kexin
LEVVEHVQVWMNMTHPRRGDVVIDLISPRGVVSHICTKRKFDVSGEGMAGWYFMSVKHWYTRTTALANERGETGIGNWTVIVSDAENGSTGKWQSWQLILWGSSIDPALAKPHPLPGSKDDPSLTPIETLPNPTVSPPLESEPASPSPSSTTAPSSGFWPWSAERKWLWIYGSIAVITLFVSVVGVWYCRQRRKARLLQTHGEGREDYEFEVLLNEGGEGVSQRRAGELYDAFAGGEEYLPDEMAGKGRRRSGEDIDDREMGGFLADSEEDEEDEVVEDEKGIQKLLKGKR